MWWRNLHIKSKKSSHLHWKKMSYSVYPEFDFKMSSHIIVYATPGPQTRRHPVIPHSCAVRSDQGRCSIHHSSLFGHKTKVWAVWWGRCNKLVSNSSTLESSVKDIHSRDLLSHFCVQPTTLSPTVYVTNRVHYTAPHHCCHSINIWNRSKQSNTSRQRDHFTDTMYSLHFWMPLAD